MAGFEPALSCSQGRRITRLSYIPCNERAAREGIEPCLSALKERCPEPIDERAIEPSTSRVDWVALESTSAVLQTAAIPSQLPVHSNEKGPAVAVTPGPVEPFKVDELAITIAD